MLWFDVILENIGWALFEVAEVKGGQGVKKWEFVSEFWDNGHNKM